MCRVGFGCQYGCHGETGAAPVPDSGRIPAPGLCFPVTVRGVRGRNPVAEFLAAAVAFPTVLFSSAVLVIAAFWLLVGLGTAEHDIFDGDVDSGALGLGGVPVAVAFSLLVPVAWLTSLTGTVLLDRTGLAGLGRGAASVGLLAGALLLSWYVTALLARPLRRVFAAGPEPSRQDFVGLTCTIRTGSVGPGFGQAEVAARDGSTALVQVRQNGRDPGLTAGSTALLYAYDEEREFFWAAPYDPALDPRSTAA